MNVDKLGGSESLKRFQEANRAATGAKDAQQSGRDSAVDGARGTDSVSVSPEARSLASARRAVNNAPDVREHRVAEIKQRIEDGTYTVDARVLARRILDSALGQG